ncbi:hypothetical protein ABIB62_003266 [Mucilaginibacter sp. UYP25]|uniref:hypothetical protein n=1 Tax=unclassified Mucilaginibacter TaxID=2617802 RepID=UPI0033920236
MNLIYSKSEVSFHNKPADHEYQKIKVTQCKTSVEELTNCIEQGIPVTAQVFEGDRRKATNFIAQTMFALDFDDTLKLSEIDTICADYRLPFNFGYPTYSHTESNPRYRIAFICDGEVRHPKLATDLNKAFSIIFNSLNDTACKDLARVWLGTNKKVFRGDLDATFNPVNVFDIANELQYSRAGNRIRKGFDINLIEKTGDNGNTILYRYRNNDIPLICDETDKQPKLIDNWKLEDLLECKLFKTFYEGGGTPLLGCKLNDSELMCMASNLMRIEGGEQLYKACLNKNKSYSDEKFSKISYLRNQCHYRTYLIGRYSPFSEDQPNSLKSQTFPELLRKKGRVEIDPSNQPRIYTLAEGEQEMVKWFDIADADTGETVYVFKLAPGLGKSQYWKNKKGIAMGFPNNNLKNEQFESSALSDSEKLVTPEALTKFTKPVQAYLNVLYNKGLNEKAHFRIKNLANGKSLFDDGHVEYEDMNFAIEYLKQNKAIKNASTDKTVFTTHTRLLHQSFNHDTYVFDENAFNTIFEHHKTSVAELTSIKMYLTLRGCVVDELEKVLMVKETGVHPTPNFTNYVDIVKEVISGDRFDTNVLKFFQSSRFMFDGEFIHYEVNHLSKLPTDKKLIFLDATASRALNEKIFGERLVFVDISNVQFQGTLIQDTSKSCSKKGLDKYHETVSAKVGDMPVITHIKYKKHFANPVDTLHFGSLTGSNALSGQDICVVGTMTYHPTYYHFLADRLNIICDDHIMKNLKVSYEGRRFWFTTFENPELQRLHLEQVEGELIQGVHRPRLIRTDATVNLYSNFPLLQAEYVY